MEIATILETFLVRPIMTVMTDDDVDGDNDTQIGRIYITHKHNFKKAKDSRTNLSKL